MNSLRFLSQAILAFLISVTITRSVYGDDLSDVDIVALSSDGDLPNDNVPYQRDSVISLNQDGTQVAFDSAASNLVKDDKNGFVDVFVRDQSNGTTERVSLKSDGSESKLGSILNDLNGDGRYVLFQSAEPGFDSAIDENFRTDIFLRDRQSQKTLLISKTPVGGSGNGASENIQISADGRYVVFESLASDLVSNDTNDSKDIFLLDRQENKLEIVSIGDNGESGNDDSFIGSVSDDGRFVAFYSFANNLVTGDLNDLADIFIRDRQSKTTTRINVNSSGEEANGESINPLVSPSGNSVLFLSIAINLVNSPSNGVVSLYKRDLINKSTVRLTQTKKGIEANNDSIPAGVAPGSISRTGYLVTFPSLATNLVNNDTNGFNRVEQGEDIYLLNLLNGSISRVVGKNGKEGNGPSGSPEISRDGTRIAFFSESNNMISEIGSRFRAVYTVPTSNCVFSRGSKVSFPPTVIQSSGEVLVNLPKCRIKKGSVAGYEILYSTANGNRKLLVKNSIVKLKGTFGSTTEVQFRFRGSVNRKTIFSKWSAPKVIHLNIARHIT